MMRSGASRAKLGGRGGGRHVAVLLAVLVALAGAGGMLRWAMANWLADGPWKDQAESDVSGYDERTGITWVKSSQVNTLFAKSEITVEQYEKCVNAGACEAKNYITNSDENACNWGYSDRAQHTMNCVNWYGAEQYCNWAAVGGHLPTDEVWAAEASANGTRAYPWGDEWATCVFAVMADGRNSDGCLKFSTWPVCSKPMGNSVSGLCDMSGNVSECTHPSGDPQPAAVVRGGQWGGQSCISVRPPATSTCRMPGSLLSVSAASGPSCPGPENAGEATSLSWEHRRPASTPASNPGAAKCDLSIPAQFGWPDSRQS